MKIKTKKQVDEIRMKYGKPPLGSQKSYKQRLKEYNESKENNDLLRLDKVLNLFQNKDNNRTR